MNKLNSFFQDFDTEYYRLYRSKDTPQGKEYYQLAAFAFDLFCGLGDTENNKKLIKELSGRRRDIIASDREAAAFMIAVMKNGYNVRKKTD